MLVKKKKKKKKKKWLHVINLFNLIHSAATISMKACFLIPLWHLGQFPTQISEKLAICIQIQIHQNAEIQLFRSICSPAVGFVQGPMNKL